MEALSFCCHVYEVGDFSGSNQPWRRKRRVISNIFKKTVPLCLQDGLSLSRNGIYGGSGGCLLSPTLSGSFEISCGDGCASWIFFLKLSALLHFNLWGFSLYVSFSKRTFQIFGGFMNPLHSPKEWPQYNGFPKICDFRDLRFLGKSSENEDFFPRANLILLPGWVVSISGDYWFHFDITWKCSSEFELRGDFGEWRDFSSSRFGPATGAMLANTFCCVSKLTGECVRFERRPLACLASPGSLQNSLLLLFR